MKIKIFGEEEDDGTVRLKLIEDRGIKRVTVIAVDRNGEEIGSGHLVSFEDDGTLHRHFGVNKKLGFKLNCSGEIELEDEDDDC